MIQVFVDGSCRGNPGPGGVGIVVNRNGSIEERRAVPVEEWTTSARLEVMAVTMALELIAEKKYRAREVVIYSDSEYAIGIATGRFMPRKNFEICDALARAVASQPGVEIRHLGGAPNPADPQARAANGRPPRRVRHPGTFRSGHDHTRRKALLSGR